MAFSLEISSRAEEQIQKIMENKSRKGLQKQLKKAFRLLRDNPRHPGLNSHLIGECDGMKVWTSYVQNRTPQAHRILWTYGEAKEVIYILQVIPHY